ncbi:MAG: LuxR C-terminal-related transcriptional regulator [Candidatus Rokuibacteriota bacterium]
MRLATPASSIIRIALMSDSTLFRSGLRRLLGTDRSLLVVGEITVPPVRDLVRKSAPQILLVDAQLESALAVCCELRHNGTRPWVILAGATGADDRWAVRALKAGARGILAKSATIDTLLKAVRLVHQGQVWASNRAIALTIEELTARAGVSEPAVQDRLSPREQQVVQLIVSGLSNLEAAARLGITEATVKAHLTRIFQKLALRGRGQLTARYHGSLVPRREPGAMLG